MKEVEFEGKKYIAEDVTPKWDEIVRMYLNMYDAMNPEGKKVVREELIRCGVIAQKYVELSKQIKEIDLDSQIQSISECFSSAESGDAEKIFIDIQNTLELLQETFE